MKFVCPYKAQGFDSILEAESVTIIINAPLPAEVHGEGARHMMRADAHRIADALLHALPSGTVDHLMIRLLEKRASNLLVPYEIIPALSLDTATQEGETPCPTA